jgi:hypothetical protein
MYVFQKPGQMIFRSGRLYRRFMYLFPPHPSHYVTIHLRLMPEEFKKVYDHQEKPTFRLKEGWFFLTQMMQ